MRANLASTWTTPCDKTVELFSRMALKVLRILTGPLFEGAAMPTVVRTCIIPTMSPHAKEPGFALAIETSGAVGSIALGRGATVLGTQEFTRPRAHAVEFFPAIDSLCAAHGASPESIENIYVSAGPGSFTGLRIGITAARTLAMAVGARIVAVPTLEVIAQNALRCDPPPAQVAVILDAKRAHVYAATFALTAGRSNDPRREPAYVPVCDPVEAEPAAYFADLDRACALLGEGVLYHRAAAQASGLCILSEETYPPRAATVYRLGGIKAAAGAFVDYRSLIPVYIRPPEAEEKWEQKPGSSGAAKP